MTFHQIEKCIKGNLCILQPSILYISFVQSMSKLFVSFPFTFIHLIQWLLQSIVVSNEIYMFIRQRLNHQIEKLLWNKVLEYSIGVKWRRNGFLVFVCVENLLQITKECFPASFHHQYAMALMMFKQQLFLLSSWRRLFIN